MVTEFGRQIMEASGENKALLVVERFMRNYLAFPEMLAIYANAQEPLHIRSVIETLQPHFTQWTADAQFEYRALWLLSCGCLSQVKGRYYQITDFGRRVAEIHCSLPSIVSATSIDAITETKVASTTSNATKSTVQTLVDFLETSALNSQSPERLEQAVAEAFEYLGFSVDQLGDTGETDVLIRAITGPGNYSVVADAKTRKDGKLNDLEVYTLLDHKKKNDADHAIVVAGDFAGGKVTRHAQDNGIVLLPVRVLSDWLRLHELTPLSLDEYRIMFADSGLRTALLPQLKLASEQKLHYARLIVDLMDLIQETYHHGLFQPLPSTQLFAMLVTRLRGVRYSITEVEATLDLLCNPAISTLQGSKQDGITLGMNRKTLANALRALASLLEKDEADSILSNS